MSLFGAVLGAGISGLFSEYSNRKARKVLQGATNAANAESRRAYGDALDFLDEGLESAKGYLNPYIEDGDLARNLYNTYLGLNGQDSQQTAYDDFQTDPGFQSEVDYAHDQIERSYANRGGVNSGRALIALSDNAQKHLRGAYQDRLNRLQGVANTGYTASRGVADLEYNTGANKGAYRTNLGQTISQNLLAGAGAQAQSYGNTARIVGSTLSDFNKGYNYYSNLNSAQGGESYNPIDQIRSVGTYLPNGQRSNSGTLGDYLQGGYQNGLNNFSALN